MIKKIVELLICILHPVAVILAWVNLAGRTDIQPLTKIVWVFLLLIPVVPVFYVIFSGDLW